MNGTSRLVIVGGLVVIAAFGLAAAIFITGDAGAERFALLLAMFGGITAALISALRADQSANQTNRASGIAQALDGSFEHRVRAAVRDVRDEKTGSTATDDPLIGPGSREPDGFSSPSHRKPRA